MSNDDRGVDYESIAVRSDQAIVSRADLLEVVQVAYWRAGLLASATFVRLCEALRLGSAEEIPKPAAKVLP